MPIYAITYDLNKEKNYQKLWDEFDRLGAKKAAKSFYLANLTTNKVDDVLKHFTNFIDEDDTLIVIKTTIDDIAAQRPLKGTFNWIKENK